jgi:hypothetical protein
MFSVELAIFTSRELCGLLSLSWVANSIVLPGINHPVLSSITGAIFAAPLADTTRCIDGIDSKK